MTPECAPYLCRLDRLQRVVIGGLDGPCAESLVVLRLPPVSRQQFANEGGNDVGRNPSGTEARRNLAWFERSRENRRERRHVHFETRAQLRRGFGFSELQPDIARQIFLGRDVTAAGHLVDDSRPGGGSGLGRKAAGTADMIDVHAPQLIEASEQRLFRIRGDGGSTARANGASVKEWRLAITAIPVRFFKRAEKRQDRTPMIEAASGARAVDRAETHAKAVIKPVEFPLGLRQDLVIGIVDLMADDLFGLKVEFEQGARPRAYVAAFRALNQGDRALSLIGCRR